MSRTLHQGKAVGQDSTYRGSLQEHIKRPALQRGHIWGQSWVPTQIKHSPEVLEWISDEKGWMPTWTTPPEASKASQELIKCECHVSSVQGLCHPCKGQSHPMSRSSVQGWGHPISRSSLQRSRSSYVNVILAKAKVIHSKDTTYLYNLSRQKQR